MSAPQNPNPYAATEVKPSPPSSPGGNPLAIVSLVLAICAATIGCCCWLHVPFGIGACVTGFLGMQKADQGHGGKGLAIAGLAIGAVVLVLYSILALLGIAANVSQMSQ